MNVQTHVRKTGISYWSVYRQQRINDALYVPDKELAAMSEHDRNRVRKWIERHAPAVEE